MKREPQKRFNKQTGVLVAIGQEKPGLFVAQQRQTGGWFCGGDHLPTSPHQIYLQGEFINHGQPKNDLGVLCWG